MDYRKLGLKAGLEIHQQLDTGKLFSRTPSFLRKDEPDYQVVRKLHAVAGETGEIDAAVAHEASLGKEVVYQGYDDGISLVELDEAPPREIDSEALDITLQIALLLNCKIYGVSQIMRKTVIDGSNTSGFQRTVLIGHSGFLEMDFGNVGIMDVALEEDSARVIDKSGEKKVYRLDRLGIPLVEITTSPELKDPGEIKETALKLGEILRACKVRRGIGTIRQDLNISIKGHDRVEIKGFQDPKIMIKTADLEVERQLGDLKKKKKSGEVRNALKNGESVFLRPMPGKERMYPETDLPLLKISRDRVNRLKKGLPKLKEEMKADLKRGGLSSELIDLVARSQKYLEEYNVLMKVGVKDANLVGKMVALWRRDFAKKTGRTVSEVEEILNERVLEEILEKVKNGGLEKGHVRELLEEVLKGKKVMDVKIEKANDNELEEKIRKIVKGKSGLSVKGYMGLVMKEIKGVDARKAMEILNRLVGS